MIFVSNQFELREWRLSDAASLAEHANNIDMHYYSIIKS